MSPNRRGIPAKTVARDFGVSLSAFVEEVIALVAELDGAASSSSPRDRCFETCAAMWATIVLSMDASALRSNEREALGPLIFTVLEPIWTKHCGTEKAAFGQLRARAQQYLQLSDAISHINTATAIVGHLFQALEIDKQSNRHLAKRLAALLAHRMLGDIHRLNEVKLQFGIQLSVLALLFSGPFASSGEVLLRVLRLI